MRLPPTAPPRLLRRRLPPPAAAMSTRPLSTPTPAPHPNPQTRIHILGIGNIGQLLAHSLRTLPAPPPVTLLFQTHTKAHLFPSTVTLRRAHRPDSPAAGFDTEVTNVYAADGTPVVDPSPIYNLLVTTKAHHTVSALRPIASRLRPESTVLILQNGMGVLQEVKEKLFPEKSKRPNFVVGITTHGVYSKGPFTVVQKGFGGIQMGCVVDATPKEKEEVGGNWLSGKVPAGPETEKPPLLGTLAETTEYLVSTLCEAAELNAEHVALPELLSVQLEKLAVNAVINPLSVLFDCRNGELLDNFYIVQLMRVVLWEVSQVLLAMPEIAGVPGREMRFAQERLYEVVIKVARATAGNWSSMLQDVRNGKQTEVDYINGYVVERARELGLPCTMNLMMVNAVKGKGKIVQMREKAAVPFVEA